MKRAEIVIAALREHLPKLGLLLVIGAAITGCTTTENDVTAPKIVAGAAHACAFDADREQVVCWGDNSYGQLGNEEFSAEGVSSPVRVKVISGRKIKSLSAGYSHTCALVSGGDDDSKNTVACWGYNHYGQVGNGTFQDSNVPVFVNGPDGNPLTGVVNLSAGAYHTCASIVNGSPSDLSNYVATTYCWGRNDKGQIGNGALTNVNVPTEIKGLDYSSAVAAGTAHTCALTSKSTDDAQAKKYVVMCWGDASRGQMRDATVEGGYSTTPIDIGLPLQGDDDGFPALFSEHVVQADVTTATGKRVEGEEALAAVFETPAYGQTCAITADQVLCWGGSNQNGQWGTDKKDVTEFAVKTEEIVSGGTLKAYGAGNAQSCMLVGKGDDSSANEVACWGYSSSLGFEMPTDATDAVVASNREKVKLQGQRPTGLAVGREFVCYAAKGEQPQIWCWGTGKKGQIGNGATTSTRVPVCVKGYCPDTKKVENLVEGQPFEEAPGPLGAVLKLSAGEKETCAVIAGGAVKCWGSFANVFPTEINDLGAIATDVSIDDDRGCALVVGGDVKCWGQREIFTAEEFILGIHAPYHARPTVYEGLGKNHKKLYMTDGMNCTVRQDETICENRSLDIMTYSNSNVGKLVGSFYWGTRVLKEPNGPSEVHGSDHLACFLKDGEVRCSSPNNTVVLDILSTGVVAADVSENEYCGVYTDGSAKCRFSEFGDVVTVQGLPPVQNIQAGESHACVLTKTGGVKCWGYFGYLGTFPNISADSSDTPIDIPGLQSGVLQLSVGANHNCALLFGGVVKCWGGGFGQLGVGTRESNIVPVTVDFSGGPRGEIVAKGANLTEGQSQYKVTVAIPARLGDTAYGFDCDGDGTYEINGEVAGHECFYGKLASGGYGVGYKITVQTGFASTEVEGVATFSVQNLPPVITAVDTDPTVIQAGSAEAKNFTFRSVVASDPGNDSLIFNYDCDRDGEIIGEEANKGNANAVCDLSKLSPATYSLNVVVDDSDHTTQGGGRTTKPITITIVPPLDTQIDTKPAAYSAVTSATFTFSSPQTDTIEYKLDSAAFALSTTGTASFTALTDGAHTFFARAVSGGNADATPDSYTWIVDTIAPVTVSDTIFTGPVSTDTVAINFSATDANAGAGFTYWCRLDGGSWGPCNSGIAIGPLIEGFHTFDMAATDAAGNPATLPATVTWSYWAPPAGTLDTSGPTQGATINNDAASFTFTSPTATSFECSLDGGAWTTCTSPADYIGLDDGTHTFVVRPVRNGVPGEPSAARTWTVDKTGPDTTIDTNNSYAIDSSATSYNVVFSCGESGCSFACKVDTGSFATCTSPYTAAVTTEGQHTVYVRAYDALGNGELSPASVTWTTTFPPGGGGGGAAVVTGATISAGVSHVCAVSSGAMYCWGFAGPQLGELVGPPEFNGFYLPTQMGSLNDWVSVSAAGSSTHTCGIRASGALYCWGGNSYGQLGAPGTSTFFGSAAPVQVAPGQTWHKVAAIDQHTCGIRADQSLWCWGSNGSGELGNGTSSYDPVTAPVQVGAATNWIDVGGGYTFTCALNADSDLYCWGWNSMGQLGVGTTNDLSAPLTAAATDVKSFTAGGEFACAVYNDGSLWCWGDNNASQGGNVVADRTLPSQVGTATDWASVEAGITHTCAIKTDGSRWCWGDWANNALGDDNALGGTQPTPVKIGGETDWLELSCSQQYCIGVRDTASKDVFSWGYNQFNRAGLDSDTMPVVSPMQQLTPY